MFQSRLYCDLISKKFNISYSPDNTKSDTTFSIENLTLLFNGKTIQLTGEWEIDSKYLETIIKKQCCVCYESDYLLDCNQCKNQLCSICLMKMDGICRECPCCRKPDGYLKSLGDKITIYMKDYKFKKIVEDYYTKPDDGYYCDCSECENYQSESDEE